MNVLSRVQVHASGRARTCAGLGIAAVLAPTLLSDYWVGTLLTQALILGIAAASLIFLSTYGGMVSLAQTALFGVAGLVVGNLATGATNGLAVGLPLAVAVVLAIGLTTVIALVFGALASRSVGIYFLMLTLTLSVTTALFFAQATSLSGFGGISGIPSPSILGAPDVHPERWYFMTLVMSVLVWSLLTYLSRTPFGMTLQGTRDDPVRMASLGYNVPLHRIAAFGVGGATASVAGVLFVWWNGHVDPATIGLSATIDLLIICVIGGLARLLGAWVGSVAFIVVSEVVHHIGAFGARFHTVIGVVFLVVVLAFPDGLVGAWERTVAINKMTLKPRPLKGVAEALAPAQANDE